MARTLIRSLGKTADAVDRGLVYGMQYLVNQTVSSIANNVYVDMTGSETLSITPGTYLVTVGGKAEVVHTAAPTSALAVLAVVDAALNIVGNASPTPAQNTVSRFRGESRSTFEIVVAVTTVYKLQGLITTTGGTITSRSWDRCSMVWQRIS